MKNLFFAWVNFRIDIARARRPTVRPRKGNGGVWRKKKNSKILCRFPEFLDAFKKVQFCQLWKIIIGEYWINMAGRYHDGGYQQR